MVPLIHTKIDLKIFLVLYIRMASNICSPKEFNPVVNMIFTKPKTNNSGGKSIGILNSNTKKSIFMQTPVMMNWGVNTYDNPNGKSYDFSLQFPREEFSSTETNEFLDMLSKFEDNVKEKAQENPRDWFGKASMSKEVIDALWSPMLKYPKDNDTGEPDKTRSPTLKVKLPVWENEFKFEVFNVDGELLLPNENGDGPESFIEKGSNTACILQCGGIWFANGKFGVTWKLFQTVVKQVERMDKGQCYINVSKEPTNEVVEEKKVNTYETDEEEEDEMVSPPQEEPVEEEPVEEEPVEEEPVVEKKKTTKKKTSKK